MLQIGVAGAQLGIGGRQLVCQLFYPLLGAHLLGNIEGEDYHAVKVPLRITPGLLDVVEIEIFQRATLGAGHWDVHAKLMMRLTGTQHLLQCVPDGVTSKFGQRFQNGSALQRAAGKQLLIGGIYQLVHQLGAAQNTNSGRCLLKQLL